MTQFTDRHAIERKPVSLSEASEVVDRCKDVAGRTRSQWNLDSTPEEIGSVRVNPHSLFGRLAHQFSLKFRRDLNRDAHDFTLPRQLTRIKCRSITFVPVEPVMTRSPVSSKNG